MRKWIRIVWFSAGAVFMLWNWSTFQARGVDSSTFQKTSTVDFQETDGLISFHSLSSEGRILLFFPGGLADPYAYAPLARALSEEGISVHIVKMPFRLAKLGYTKIDQLFDLHDPNQRFFLAGHSQGAKMAAQYIYDNPGTFDALILIGTSHPRDISLAGTGIPTLKLYAEFDGLASPNEVLGNKHLLPKNTLLKLVEGGNHSQFANLGLLLGDDEATICREKQQLIVKTTIVGFLNNL